MMETYIDYKPFTHNPNFKANRQATLQNLDLKLVDSPLRILIKDINRLPCIFTLQCCHGHFLKKNGKEISTLELSEIDEQVQYKLAYIAICLENSRTGENIRQSLLNIPLSIDRGKIQFCSAKWFWEQWLNTYVLQVMPNKFKDRDTAPLEYPEAREIGRVRDELFLSLKDFVASLSS
jgi:hypothetical protein